MQYIKKTNFLKGAEQINRNSPLKRFVL